MSFTVTATEGGSVSNGIGLQVKVLTGQAAAQPGKVASATQTGQSLAITPNASGSLVYGSELGLAGTYTPLASTTSLQDGHSIAGLELLSFESAAKTTSGTPVTLGYTATSNGISLCLAEILAAAVLAEDASSPAGVTDGTHTTVTTAAFTPPAGSLLVAMVQSNGGAGVITMSITDTSGLGLTWAKASNGGVTAEQNGAGNGYSGIWIAAMPAPAAAAGGGLGFDAVTRLILGDDW